MDGFRFDHLTRLVGARLNRRTSLALIVAGVATQTPSPSAAKGKKISICYKGQTRKVKKQDWKKKYKGATKAPARLRIRLMSARAARTRASRSSASRSGAD